MVHKVFWDDPYLTTLQTEVGRVIGDQVTLRDTIFFAQSGGQESDKGTIGVFPVLNARWEGKDIRYTLPPDHDLRAGNVVTIMIDWPRRYSLMRLHFAAEIVLELVYSTLKKPKKIGAHIAEDKARIDFDFKDNIDKHLDKLTLLANIVVTNNYVIESGFSDRRAERRYWKIPGFAEIPCGGTHLKRTGEIGEISLKRKNVGRGKERIEVRVA